jgi:hypothetical protein
VVTEAPVSRSSRTLPASLIRAFTRIGWPGVKRIWAVPAATGMGLRVPGAVTAGTGAAGGKLRYSALGRKRSGMLSIPWL